MPPACWCRCLHRLHLYQGRSVSSGSSVKVETAIGEATGETIGETIGVATGRATGTGDERIDIPNMTIMRTWCVRADRVALDRMRRRLPQQTVGPAAEAALRLD